MTNMQRALTQSDLTDIEHIIYKYNDDFTIALARNFERLEERIDATETRLLKRIADIEALLGQEDF